MGDFFQYNTGANIEHFCGDEWVPDTNNSPHEKCGICGKQHILAGDNFTKAVQHQEAQKEENLLETFEVEVPNPRRPGEDWDGTWGKWSSGKGRESWGSLKRSAAALRTAANPPEEYRIVKVLTRPEVIVRRETVEEHNLESHDDYQRLDSSRAWMDEGAKPVTDLSSIDQEEENDRTKVSTVPSIADYDDTDGEKMSTRFEENFKISLNGPDKNGSL